MKTIHFLIGLFIVVLCMSFRGCDFSELTDPTPTRTPSHTTGTPTNGKKYITIKRKVPKLARFTECTERSNWNTSTPHKFEVEVRQDGVRKIFKSSGDITLSRKKNVFIKAVHQGEDATYIKMHSIGVQLSGGEQEGRSNFINEQLKSKSSSGKKMYCEKVELTETLYPPLVEDDKLIRIIVSTRNDNLGISLRYKD